MSEPSVRDLAVKMAQLEERMKTMQAEYKTDIAMLAADNAKRAEEAAKRETRIILTIGGLIVAGVTILSVLIRWPG